MAEPDGLELQLMRLREALFAILAAYGPLSDAVLAAKVIPSDFNVEAAADRMATVMEGLDDFAPGWSHIDLMNLSVDLLRVALTRGVDDG
jgi:hypothetical protein